MNIHIITVAYGLAEDLKRLVESCITITNHVTFHIFLHSQFPDVVRVFEELTQRADVIGYPYGVNRGLSRSWNEGLIEAQKLGADAMIIANDDIVVAPNHVRRLAYAALHYYQDYGLVSPLRYDIRSKKFDSAGFGFGVVNRIALEKVGYFDCNYFPIYWEDVDWLRRCTLAGLDICCYDETWVVHQGSASLSVTPNDQHQETFKRNKDFYALKWGGEPGNERYEHPFNNPAFSLKIEAAQIDTPYPGYMRTDQSIVRV